MEIKLTLPLNEVDIENLKVGDRVLLTGELYTGRDAAHKRLVETLERGEKLPIDVKGQLIYYVGPSPAKEGEAIGSAGPTTSYRMDSYAGKLMDLGLKGSIGKGNRSKEIIDNIIKNKAIYLGAIGGAAALISKTIKKAEVVAYEDLGTEAIRKLYVEDFPAIVVIDSRGNNLYELGRENYLKNK
ncbi:MAG: Fe-S-containing hydro-lyase [Sarcina sp.]